VPPRVLSREARPLHRPEAACLPRDPARRLTDRRSCSELSEAVRS
jgi:hypothetical protein